MRLAILGRTEILLDAARRLHDRGHGIGLVGTCRSENHYAADESDFETFARESGAGFFNTPAINSAEIVERLRAAECEIAVSMNWLTVLGEAALAAFPRGVVNAHAGDLPRFRGNACPNWAILMGEERAGLCLHFMEAGELDSGPVLLRDHFALGPKVYIGDFYDWMRARVPAMAVAAIEGLESGTLKPEPQATDPALSLRCYPRRPEDARIDWRRPADDIHRLIRASSRPFDGAFTLLEGTRRVTVWRAEPFAHRGPFAAVPGQVMLREGPDPVIACGGGALQLTDVTLDGADDGPAAKAEICRSLRQRLI